MSVVQGLWSWADDKSSSGFNEFSNDENNTIQIFYKIDSTNPNFNDLMYIAAAAAEPQINSIKNQTQQKLTFGLFQAFINFLGIIDKEKKNFVLFTSSNSRLLSQGQYIFGFDQSMEKAKIGLILPMEYVNLQQINVQTVKNALLDFMNIINILPTEPK